MGGWVPADPQTLLLEGSNNVFVLGDTTNIPIEKAYRQRTLKLMSSLKILVPESLGADGQKTMMERFFVS